MSTHKVSVNVDGRSIRVSPDPLVMTIQEDVHWVCAGPQRFSIEFDGAGPFAARKLAHDAANSPQRPRGRGHYKYTVALESDPSVRLDPEVIVEDPPSKPNP